MNEKRREKIRGVILNLDKSLDCLKEVKDDEELSYDSLPESFQGSERGERMFEAIDNLCVAIDDIDEAKDLLKVIIKK